MKVQDSQFKHGDIVAVDRDGHRFYCVAEYPVPATENSPLSFWVTSLSGRCFGWIDERDLRPVGNQTRQGLSDQVEEFYRRRRRPAESTGVNVDDLKPIVDRLKSLLDDPQPGFVTWHEFVVNRLDEICDLYRCPAPNSTSEVAAKYAWELESKGDAFLSFEEAKWLEARRQYKRST